MRLATPRSRRGPVQEAELATSAETGKAVAFAVQNQHCKVSKCKLRGQHQVLLLVLQGEGCRCASRLRDHSRALHAAQHESGMLKGLNLCCSQIQSRDSLRGV